MDVEKLKNSEKQAWIVTALCLGLVFGVFIGQAWMSAMMYPVWDKVQTPTNGTQQLTTTPINPPNDNPVHGAITHFAFYDTPDSNGGQGFVGAYVSGSIWYIRWHTVSIQEMGNRAGKLLLNYSFYDFSNNFYSTETVLEFYAGEIKVGLEFLITVSEFTKDNVDYGTCKLEMVGET